ncbi:hypothetical protein SQ3_02018 [Enterococcus faecalis EnGen0212]|uniref:YopX family protein n=1 Tax=Enterococcus faecalis TaxID=1351 RepID=UPI0003302CF1|nr:YopX family protein [Enterococcus faecalis]EHR4558410.1 hypothetical protein [Enterococcus faecalis]EOG91049.1 hypothetical protein SQ3_02018 [Enterococcus faecalis EnGen0212]HAP5710333.1 hypothetical protein [Enterococcus faecalis]
MIPKFRAWLKEELEMQDVLAFDTRGHSFLGIEGTNVRVEGWCDYFEVDKQAVIMQSTGLKDLKGVEIFESDLVKVIDGESEEDSYISVVKNYSNEGYPAFDIEYPPNYHYDRNVLSAIMCNGFETIEVTGNVYDNPELLEVAE